MALTDIVTKPILRGSLMALGRWNFLTTQAGFRVYPYKSGCGVRTNASGTTVNTYGMGTFAAGDWAMVCTRTTYGSSWLYLPNTSKRHAVDTIGTADDELTCLSAVTADKHDWLLNLGVDPSLALNGSTVTLYDNPVGDGGAQGAKYFGVGNHGLFYGWVEDADGPLLDLLITNGAGIPLAVWPSFEVGSGVVV